MTTVIITSHFVSQAAMDALCICNGCGRGNCGAFGGRPICENALRKKGWAKEEGHCTSCVCRQCGAVGKPCFDLCSTQQSAASSHQPQRQPQIPPPPPPPPPSTQPPKTTHQPPPPPPPRQSVGPAAASSQLAQSADASAQAIAAANAAVPEPATMENLLHIIVDLQNRLYAVEQELEGLRSGRDFDPVEGSSNPWAISFTKEPCLSKTRNCFNKPNKSR